jgi:hypothetical protein
LLERHVEEYEKALVKGDDVEGLREIHKREIAEAEANQIAVGLKEKMKY